jgi:hypothetical protein
MASPSRYPEAVGSFPGGEDPGGGRHPVDRLRGVAPERLRVALPGGTTAPRRSAPEDDAMASPSRYPETYAAWQRDPEDRDGLIAPSSRVLWPDRQQDDP